MNKCNICSRVFKTKQGLKLHQTKKHNSKKEKEFFINYCPHCGLNLKGMMNGK